MRISVDNPTTEKSMNISSTCHLIVSVLGGIALLVSTSHGSEQQEVVALWPSGLPADARPVDPDTIELLKKKQQEQPDHLSYVDNPTFEVYPAPGEKANGCAAIVCPGGGYNMLSWPKEGTEVAEWLNTLGVTAFVLKYRVPRRDPERIHWEPMQDLQRAIRLVRHRADQWKIEPNRVGVVGFSAGGHLAVMAGTHFDARSYDRVDEADDLSCRPDFICPIYVAYLGDGFKDDKPEIGGLVQVTENTPPTFLAVSADDNERGAQSALLFLTLHQQGVPAELHIYSQGGHGYGLRPSSNPVSTWHHRLADWLKVQGLLGKDRTLQTSSSGE